MSAMAQRRREESRSAGNGGVAWDREKAWVESDRDRDRGKERERGNKEREKEKGREKDDPEKEKGKERDRDKEDREKVKERDRGKEKDRDKAKEKERDMERQRERDSNKERQREKEKERDRERERDMERDRQKFKQKDRDRERDREHDKERQKSKQRDKDRETDVEKREEREKQRDERDKAHKGLQSSASDLEARVSREKDRQKPRQREEDSEKRGEREKQHDEHGKPPKEEQPSSAELGERISRIREERIKSNGDTRKVVPEKPDDENDVSAWVKKSRKLEIIQAERTAKMLAEQDKEEEEEEEEGLDRTYGATKSLAGLKVRHGLDKVLDGGTLVLTLKDSNILAGDSVNEEGDELEDVEMAQQRQREDAYKAAKKKPGTYEDKFSNDISGIRTILPQYDEAIKEEGVVLDESGSVCEESKQKLEEIRRKLQGIGSQMEQSLNSKTVAADYLTAEEMLQFKKPKKKKKLRKKIDIYALEAEAIASGVAVSDHGSRASGGVRAAKRAEEADLAEARKKAYQTAFQKAADASKALLEVKSNHPMQVGEEVPVIGAEEDDELNRSLERARRAALKKQAESSTAGPQAIAGNLAAGRQSVTEAPSAPAGVDGEKLVFTDTGEFCRSLQLDEAITRRGGPKDAFGEEEEEAAVVPMEEDTPKAGGGWTEVNEAAKAQGAGEEANEEKEEQETPIKEVSVGRGLSGALQLLKERGTLKETVDWGGRNMDKKKSKLIGIADESMIQTGQQREIILDRVDEFGRTMTPKEAFRKLSHKFHGKGPGKMKQEKRMKQHQEELKLKQMNSGDTPLMSMEKIREAQANLHSPYIVISGHIKPGQTSDPRSGFATVEKEPIGSLTPMLGDKNKVGSLTPMLGDKKVEHFLGIKRKHHGGSMGPPPPKKPKEDN